MNKTVKLRLAGSAILLFNLWLIGRFNMNGPAVAVITIGFVIAYEYFVVRRSVVASSEKCSNKEPAIAKVISEPAAPEIIQEKAVVVDGESSSVATVMVVSAVALAALLFLIFIFAAIVTGA